MQVTRVSELRELNDLRDEWTCLTRGVPFRSWQWLLSWWEHFGPGRELFVLAVRDAQGSLVGLAPWFMEQRPAAGRVLQFLGSGEVCTDYASILTTWEHEDHVVHALAEWLVAAGRGGAGHECRWDLLELDGVTAGDSVIAKLAAHLHELGCSVNRRSGLNCWRAMLPDQWESYFNELPKPLKRSLRRTQRVLEQSSGCRVVLADDRAGVARGFELLVDLHQRRRQRRGETGCFASPAFTAFLRDAAMRLFNNDALQLAWLELSGRPVACEFAVVSDRVCYVYQSGIDPDVLRISPGHALTAELIRRSIKEGREALDFLRGDEPYKARWLAGPLPTVRLRIAPHRLAPQVRNGVWLAGQTMKQWVKSGLTLTGMH